jgi:hypothetical protein
MGVLLGVWLTQQGAARVARQTLEGQRTLARDAALRDYRLQRVTPYLEAAKRRFSVWYEMGAHVGIDDSAKRHELIGQVTDPDFNILIATYAEIPDDAFRTAFLYFAKADTGPDPEQADGFTRKEIMDRVAQMRLALVELSTASQHYIFSVESDGVVSVGHKEARRRGLGALF